MSVKNLLDPILEQGIRHTNYFEGRLLTAEDLRDQQSANREHDRLLGRAIGAGIIEGLEVELDDGHDGSDGKPPVVTVKKGLAINNKGEVIGLKHNDIKLALSRSLKVVNIDEATFYDCAGPPGNQHLPNGVGVYILVMSPIAGYKERAPKSGLGDEGIVKGCGSRYIQEGVQFRLVELNPTSLNGISDETKSLLADDLLSQANPVLKNDSARLSKLRNIIAHLCFGTEELINFATDPFDRINGQSRYQSYGALDELRNLQELNDCDVPLTLLYWTLDGIAFTDLWSVRRMFPNRDTVDQWTPSNITFSRVVAEAVFLQFQHQISDLSENIISPQTIQAAEYFYFLPPAGVIPLISAGSKGFSENDFFHDMTYRNTVFIEESRLDGLLMQSFTYPPLLLESGEFLWLYYGQENHRAMDVVPKTQQKFVIFTAGHMPYFSSPRFDLSRWSYSNYVSSQLGPEGL